MENIISMLDHVPVGFRFRPTDEELVNYYLKHKLLNDDFPVHIIPEIDVCKVEPWDVPARSVIKSDDQEWFFFSPVDYKYQNSKRVNRTTEHGYWKSTGKDRNIRRRGSTNVIGTKKTLVFHRGRVPDGDKSNWVIHEYQAITSHQTQRTFVLCRLMKKAEKKTEREIEAPNFDEGEPSRPVVPDHEIPATSVGIPSVSLTEIDIEAIFQAMQESPTDIGQEPFSPNSPSLDVYFRNDNQKQTPFEATDDEDEFVNSIWAADEEFVFNEERRHCFVNSSTQPKSLRRVYNGSSEIDAEVVSNLHDNINSGEYPTLKIFKSSHDAIRGGTSWIASNHEANIEKKQNIIQDDFGAVETSSCDSTPDEPIERGRTDNFILQRTVTGRTKIQRKVSNNAVSKVEAQKELLNVKSEKDQKNAQNTSSRGNFKTRSHQSSEVNRKGSFIYMETVSSNQSQFPRSVYLVNVVIGILLLIVISWEVLSC